MGGARRVWSVALIFCAIALSAAASADEPKVLEQKYNLGGQVEVTFSPAMSVFDKYTQHVATSVGAAYFFNDIFGLEFDAGYAFISGDRKLLDNIVSTAVDTLEGIERLPLTNLKYMTWFASAGAVLCPLYGKLNFSSEYAVNIHLYLVAGAGLADYRYHKLGAILPGRSGFAKSEFDEGVKPNFFFGGGLRFHLTHNWSLRFEIRDLFFYDEYQAQKKDPRDPKTGKILDVTLTGFVHTTLMRLGVGYSF